MKQVVGLVVSNPAIVGEEGGEEAEGAGRGHEEHQLRQLAAQQLAGELGACEHRGCV